eukprot:3090526-Pyramimonas_sp.AAC.1
MDDMWAEVAAEQHTAAAEPPSYITDSATFRAVPEAAARVGASLQRNVHHIESFYCRAYKVSNKDQQLFRGRGVQYELKNVGQKEKGQR